MHLFFLYIVIIFSAVFHEYAHAYTAYSLGDTTAKDEGRLTLNPIVHIDIMGTILIPLLLLFTSGIFLGWAKPVPYNPYALSDHKYGSLKVAIAGPISNIFIAIVLGVFIRLAGAPLITSGLITASFIDLLSLIIYVNIILAIFNLIPIPPLDGSKIAADLWPEYGRFVSNLGFIGIFVALFIGFTFLAGIANTIFYIITGS